LGFILRERRRYFRYALRMPVTLIVEDKQMKATSTDISEGGIALLTHQALPKNSAPHIQFSLPGISRSFEVETEVAWADLRGRVGLRFIKVPSTTQIQLETWLNEHAENASPISSKPPATPAAH
jgi:c-di-GMP-binding flagellar brake protein YcgR